MKISPRLENAILSFAYFISFLFVLFLLNYYERYINQDQAMYLYAGRLILQGQVPFVDFFDINPPLIMYLNSVLILVADTLHINEIQLFKIFVALLYFSFIFICLKIMRRNFGLTLYGYLASLLFLTSSLVTLMYLGFWGQRDELFGFVVIPYLFIKSCRLMNIGQTSETTPLSKMEVIWIGFWLAIFVCLKPHFFLLFLAIEIYFWYSVKKIRRFVTTELILTICAVLAYLLVLSRFPSLAISNFVQNADDVFNYYKSFNRYFSDALGPAALLCFPALLALFFIFRNGKKADIYILPLCLSVLIWLIIIFSQGRLFQYHFVGVYLLGCFLSIMINLKKYAETQSRLLHFLPGVFLFFFAVYNGSQYFNKRNSIFNYNSVLEQEISKYTNAGDYALTLSSMPRTSYPAYNNLKLKNTSRYLFAYPISFFGSLRYNSKNGLLDMPIDPIAVQKEKNYFEDLKKDITLHPPKIIYFDLPTTHRQNLPLGFPLLDYLKMNGLIDFIETRYKKISKDAFVIYIRDN